MPKGRLTRIRFTPAMSIERKGEYLERNERIRYLRLVKRWPIADIAAEFGITIKRVSQIAPSGFRVRK